MPPAVAVVGHVEWVTFARVARLPAQGEIVHATDVWREAAGGGAVAAVQLARLAGHCEFFTAAGPAVADLRRWGVRVHSARETLREAFVHTDDEGERTITVLGARAVPHGDDALNWRILEGCDAVYYTGGDAAAARLARRARVMVASARAHDSLAGVEVDVLVLSGNDADEARWAGGLRARRTVYTDGERGGRWIGHDGEGEWAAAPLPGPVVDAYGCGDSFAAGLTFALGRGDAVEDALGFAAACGAACLTGRGPYGSSLPAP